jgi:hypothetical protein
MLLGNHAFNNKESLLASLTVVRYVGIIGITVAGDCRIAGFCIGDGFFCYLTLNKCGVRQNHVVGKVGRLFG